MQDLEPGALGEQTEIACDGVEHRIELIAGANAIGPRAARGGTALAAYDGDAVLAKVAAELNTVMIQSGASLVTMEKLREVGPTAWFQAYLPGEPEIITPLVERARRIKLGNPLDRATEMNFRLRLRLIDKLGLGDEVADYMGLWTLTRNFINSDRGLAVMRANQANIRSNSVELYRAFVLSLLRWGRCEPEQHAEPKFTSELGKIRAPTLVVTSDNDHLIPASLSELIAAKVIGARLSVLSGAGHIPFMEQPDKVVPLVVDFINSLPVR